VILYLNNKRIIIKHIGSGTSEAEITFLEEMRRVFIADYTKQSYAFEESKPNERSVLVITCEYTGINYTY
jgi:hypothetical protein